MMAYSNNFIAALVCRGDIVRELRDGTGANTVLIPFGSEYSIRLKNKEARKAVAHVEVDGRDATGHGGIIVGPNDVIDLQGWMDGNLNVPHKFKFIQKTKEIKDFRGDKIDDGFVTIRFQFEKHLPIIPIQPSVPKLPTPWAWPRPYYGPRLKDSIDPDVVYGAADILCSSHNDVGNPIGQSAMIDSFVPQMDEGITVEGSHSDQFFVSGHTRELEEAIHTITFQLRGATASAGPVEKPVTVRRKIQCKTCGRSNRSSERFCGNCGTAVIL